MMAAFFFNEKINPSGFSDLLVTLLTEHGHNEFAELRWWIPATLYGGLSFLCHGQRLRFMYLDVTLFPPPFAGFCWWEE